MTFLKKNMQNMKKEKFLDKLNENSKDIYSLFTGFVLGGFEEEVLGVSLKPTVTIFFWRAHLMRSLILRPFNGWGECVPCSKNLCSV